MMLNKDKNHVSKGQEEDGHEAVVRALRLEQQIEQRRRLKKISEGGSKGNGIDGSTSKVQVLVLIETTRN